MISYCWEMHCEIINGRSIVKLSMGDPLLNYGWERDNYIIDERRCMPSHDGAVLVMVSPSRHILNFNPWFLALWLTFCKMRCRSSTGRYQERLKYCPSSKYNFSHRGFCFGKASINRFILSVRALYVDEVMHSTPTSASCFNNGSTSSFNPGIIGSTRIPTGTEFSINFSAASIRFDGGGAPGSSFAASSSSLVLIVSENANLPFAKISRSLRNISDFVTNNV